MEKPRSRDGIDSVSRSKSPAEFAERLQRLAREHVPGVAIGCDDQILTAPSSPLWERTTVFGREINVRLAAHPTEGWDAFGEADDGVEGMPSPWTLNRWTGFGLSGMQLLLGGEAYAVVREGKANPHQLFYSDAGKAGPEQLRAAALRARLAAFRDDNLVAGLQLTHSGQYCCPDFGKGMQPMPAVWHPIIGPRFGATPELVVTDSYLDDLVGHYVTAAKLAQEAGFDFVDIKHCHGYLLHQLLGAHTRDGSYGGSFENRTRFLREVVRAIRSECPGLGIMVRISVFDHAPILRGGETAPAGYEPHRYMFGVSEDGSWAPDEVYKFLRVCEELDVGLVSVTYGVPYYSSQVQRPAHFFAPDADVDPTDPLIRVLEQQRILQEIKCEFPDLLLAGTSYALLQQYLPHVLQWLVREGHVDFPGVSRSFIAEPRIADLMLSHGKLGRICRTFSDCTGGPRTGRPSLCYPLDPLGRELGFLPDIRSRKPHADGKLPPFPVSG